MAVTAAAESRLFKPLKLTSKITLKHRVAMAPLTRYRADDEHVPIAPIVPTYYGQRGSVPGTLLVTEATIVAPAAGGYDNVPGIYTAAQVAGWRKVTEAVHARGSFIFLQLWSLGRTAHQRELERDGFKVHSASDIPMPNEGAPVPVPMTVAEIKQRVKDYANAAKNAIEAGFDGVEIHGANGYLIDQFLQDNSNQRTDEYGGSVENRSRFALEVVDAVVEAVGAERTAIRFSPYNTFQGMRMKDPKPQFTHVVSEINKKHRLAYVHFVQTRIVGETEAQMGEDDESLDFVLKVWDGPVLIAGGLAGASAKHLLDQHYKDKDVVAVFGRYFISTPDLPFRLREGIEPNHYDRLNFYTPKTPVGYIDQPFSKEFEALHGPQPLN